MATALRSDRGSPQQSTGGRGGGALLLVGGAAVLGVVAYELFKPHHSAVITPPTQIPVSPIPPAQCGDFGPPPYWGSLDPAAKATAVTFCILLGRQPSQADVSFWDHYYISGGPGAAQYTGIPAVAIGIINDSSEEYRARQDAWATYVCSTQLDCTDGTQYPLAWVIGLYENLLGRQPASTESAYWVPLFNSTGRLQVASDFCNGPEFATRVMTQVAVWGQ